MNTMVVMLYIFGRSPIVSRSIASLPERLFPFISVLLQNAMEFFVKSSSTSLKRSGCLGATIRKRSWNFIFNLL